VLIITDFNDEFAQYCISRKLILTMIWLAKLLLLYLVLNGICFRAKRIHSGLI